MEAPPPSPPQPNQWEKRLTSSPATAIRIQQQQVVRLSGCFFVSSLRKEAWLKGYLTWNTFRWNATFVIYVNAVLHKCLHNSVILPSHVCACTWFKTQTPLLSYSYGGISMYFFITGIFYDLLFIAHSAPEEVSIALLHFFLNRTHSPAADWFYSVYSVSFWSPK